MIKRQFSKSDIFVYDFDAKGKILTQKSGKLTMFHYKFILQISNLLEIVL